jgi:hypothetical protein
MSNYTKATNFATKDTLPTGNSGKIVKGTEIDDEFNAIASAISSKADTASPTFTGTPAAPTAGSGTNTTQIATTAFVTGALSGLGNMSTQAKSAVDITGGTIVGITDLAVADGGTGASTAADARTNLGLGTVATLNAIATANITDANVTTAKIADANVTAAKLSGAQSGSAPVFGARAWGRFNGTGSVGNQTITGSGNVASVAKTDTGRYTVTLTTAMPNANYCAVATAEFSTSDGSASSVTAYDMTTTTFKIATHRTDTDTPAYTDSELVNFVIFG